MDDYSEGAHPRILEALTGTNLSQQAAYGDDDYCEIAKSFLRKHIDGGEMSIHFLPSGTAANLISIASCLRPFEAVIAASSAHIATQEAGAIEATGHHIIRASSTNGKLTAASIQQAVKSNDIFPHTVLPRLVYLSNASELGTVYTKEELAEIAAVCKSFKLLLFMDGARLGTALCSRKANVTLNDIFQLTDLFWIGGTKNGALFGEAIIIKEKDLARTFAYHVKQRGALLAKGRAMGVQFMELFRSNLFFDLATHANQMAERLSSNLQRLQYRLASEVETNLIFVTMPHSVIRGLQARFNFHIWEELEGDCALVRFVTSWATELEQVEAFNSYIEELPAM